MNLVDQRRLADAGVPSDEHHLGSAPARALEGLEQTLDFAVASIEPLRNLEALGVSRSGPARIAPVPTAADRLQVGHEARRALVAVLGLLGHELADDLRQRERNVGIAAVRRDGIARDLAMDQLHLVVRVERATPREHLVEGRAQGVEVGPVVERPVHAPRLLRRHVGQRALEDLRALHDRVLGGKPRRDAEVDDLHLAGAGIDDEIRGVDVLVNDVGAVHLPERDSDLDGGVQELVEDNARSLRRSPMDMPPKSSKTIRSVFS